MKVNEGKSSKMMEVTVNAGSQSVSTSEVVGSSLWKGAAVAHSLCGTKVKCHRQRGNLAQLERPRNLVLVVGQLAHGEFGNSGEGEQGPHGGE